MNNKGLNKISYELSVRDALELYYSVPKISTLVDIDILCLIDRHLVVNLEQFISEDHHLTDYAIKHPDECCIGVIRENEIKTRISKESVAVLDMMIDSAVFSEKSVPVPDNQSKEDKKREAGNLLNEKKRLRDEIAKLPGDFGGSLKKLMKNHSYTIEKLAEDTGLSESTIKLYRGKPMATYNKKNVIAMGIAMHLHPWYTEELLKKARLELSNVEPDPTLKLLYTYCYKAESLWECNEIIGEEIFKRTN